MHPMRGGGPPSQNTFPPWMQAAPSQPFPQHLQQQQQQQQQQPMPWQNLENMQRIQQVQFHQPDQARRQLNGNFNPNALPPGFGPGGMQNPNQNPYQSAAMPVSFAGSHLLYSNPPPPGAQHFHGMNFHAAPAMPNGMSTPNPSFRQTHTQASGPAPQIFGTGMAASGYMASNVPEAGRGGAPRPAESDPARSGGNNYLQTLLNQSLRGQHHHHQQQQQHHQQVFHGHIDTQAHGSHALLPAGNLTPGPAVMQGFSGRVPPPNVMPPMLNGLPMPVPVGPYGSSGHPGMQFAATHGSMHNPILPLPPGMPSASPMEATDAHALPQLMNVAGSVEDAPVKEVLMSLKEFLMGDPKADKLSVAEAQAKYEAYKVDFERRNPDSFFAAHCNEDWFHEKYDPVRIRALVDDARDRIQKRAELFKCEFELARCAGRPEVVVPTLQEPNFPVILPEESEGSVLGNSLYIRYDSRKLSRALLWKIMSGELLESDEGSGDDQKQEADADPVASQRDAASVKLDIDENERKKGSEEVSAVELVGASHLEGSKLSHDKSNMESVREFIDLRRSNHVGKVSGSRKNLPSKLLLVDLTLLPSYFACAKYVSEEEALRAMKYLQGFEVFESDVQADREQAERKRMKDELDRLGVEDADPNAKENSESGDDSSSDQSESGGDQHARGVSETDSDSSSASSSLDSGTLRAKKRARKGETGRAKAGAVVWTLNVQQNIQQRGPRPSKSLLPEIFSSQERVAHDAKQAKQLCMHLNDLRGVSFSLRHSLKEWLDALATDSERLDFCIAYLRRVHRFCYYSGDEILNENRKLMLTFVRSGVLRLAVSECEAPTQDEEANKDALYENVVPAGSEVSGIEVQTVVTDAAVTKALARSLDEDAKVFKMAYRIGSGCDESDLKKPAERSAVESEVKIGLKSNRPKDADVKKEDEGGAGNSTRMAPCMVDAVLWEKGLLSDGVRARERAEWYWRYDHMVSEKTHQHKRCAYCDKLFKSADFLNLHLTKNHWEQLLEVLKEVDADVYLRNFLADPRKPTLEHGSSASKRQQAQQKKERAQGRKGQGQPNNKRARQQSQPSARDYDRPAKIFGGGGRYAHPDDVYHTDKEGPSLVEYSDI
ncbi:Serrate RNA effector molecule-like [Porphyridium purpureum]|uniref:Serrate RNA effector molecule-like n=1 Tax=Porphyridium purpureum TaxID=35688 RepID=A0A5J4YZJ6_PORPP|nr:Serrate RNA effector molecule-like [Porphyridium purpureum]|eukprot:POR9093..scf208_2